MPRNGSGSYSLPAGNPVSSGTLIEASWANTTLSDLASAMTDSLARSGEGGMTGPLRAADGTVSTPSVSFVSETATGFYRAGATDVRFAMAGVDVATLTTAGVTVGSTKVLALPDGTAAAPALTNTGDTNTGVFFPNADIVGVSTGGTERLRVDASGNVGIGTSSPAYKLDVQGASGVGIQLLETSTGNNNRLRITQTAGITNYQLTYTSGSTNAQTWSIGNNEHMRLDSSGRNLIGYTVASGSNKLQVTTTTTAYAEGGLSLLCGNGANNIGTNGPRADINVLLSNNWRTSLLFKVNTSDTDTAPVEVARITSAGDLLVGTTSGIGVGAKTNIYSAAGNGLHVQSASAAANNIVSYDSAGIPRFSVSNGGTVSKTSGSFKIDHPLPELENTHYLVHSFVESPTADNIYRGVVKLENGSATISIDRVAGMTSGTFVALNRNAQCFTSNESDWDAVRGTLNAGVLTIESQNPASSASVSWLVIGERQDKHMYETSWTDNDGKVIVEPKKP